MSKSPITCHVLDSSTGKPASGVEVHLQDMGVFEPFAEGRTDLDGRCLTLLPPSKQLKAGIYKIVFKTKEYFEVTGRKSFYPWVEIPFEVVNPEEHHHIPLLISPYSFTTYRGS